MITHQCLIEWKLKVGQHCGISQNTLAYVELSAQTLPNLIQWVHPPTHPSQYDPVRLSSQIPSPIKPSEGIYPDTLPNMTQWDYPARIPAQSNPVRASIQTPFPIWPSKIIFPDNLHNMTQWYYLPDTQPNMTLWDRLHTYSCQYDPVRLPTQTPCPIWRSEVIYPDTMSNMTQWGHLPRHPPQCDPVSHLPRHPAQYDPVRSSTQTPFTMWPSEVIYPDTLHNVTQWGHLPRHPGQYDPVRSSTQTPCTMWPIELSIQ